MVQIGFGKRKESTKEGAELITNLRKTMEDDQKKVEPSWWQVWKRQATSQKS